jgi:beta-catenin-like protein 1
VLKKFIEDDYAKLDRLLALRVSLLNRIRKREKDLDTERQDLADQGLELDDVEIYLNKLEAGLLSLQLADYVLAWVCMEDDGVSTCSPHVYQTRLANYRQQQARDHTKTALSKQGASFAEVIKVLQEYQDNIGDSPRGTSEGEGEAKLSMSDAAAEADAANKRQIIGHLISYLRSC